MLLLQKESTHIGEVLFILESIYWTKERVYSKGQALQIFALVKVTLYKDTEVEMPVW